MNFSRRSILYRLSNIEVNVSNTSKYGSKSQKYLGPNICNLLLETLKKEILSNS